MFRYAGIKTNDYFIEWMFKFMKISCKVLMVEIKFIVTMKKVFENGDKPVFLAFSGSVGTLHLEDLNARIEMKVFLMNVSFKTVWCPDSIFMQKRNLQLRKNTI